jgi:uncharacterized oligopeptide transporter (OPT) family protein
MSPAAAQGHTEHIDRPDFHSALEALMFWTVAFAVVAGILMARALKEGLLAFIGLAIGFSIVEAFFNPPLALTFIALAVLAFVFYVTSKAAWQGALTPLREESSRSEVGKRDIMGSLF